MPGLARVLGASLTALLLLVSVAAQPSSSGPGSVPGPDDYLLMGRDLYVNPRYAGYLYSYTPVSGVIDVLVVYVYFADVTPSETLESIGERLDNVSSYFAEASYGYVTGITWWTLLGDPWIQLPNELSYYGAPGPGSPDARAYELVLDSLSAIDPYVNFTEWSYVLIIHAGGDEAVTGDPNDIWSFAYIGFEYPSEEGDVILGVAVVSEFDPVGVIAHEVGHAVFRWPDLYDYAGAEEFVGSWGLMGKGAWNGDPPGSSPAHPVSWSKAKAGWIGGGRLATVGAGESVIVELTASEVMGGVNAIQIPLDPWRYYLVEARVWEGFDSYLPGEGVLILYVDETLGSGEGIVRVVDSTPGDGDVDNGEWAPGSSFYDEANDVFIKVLERRDKYTFIVGVAYGVGPGLAPSISLSPSWGPAGIHVVVEGEGFTPFSRIEVRLGGALVAAASADSSGSFRAVARVPGLDPGVYSVVAVDELGVEASAEFNLTLARVSVEPANASIGSLVSVEASGLGPGLPYWVKIDDIVVALAWSGPDGSLSLDLRLPPLDAGAHVVALVYDGNLRGIPSPWLEVASGGFHVSDGVATRGYVEEAVSSALAPLQASLAALEERVEALEERLEALNETLVEVNATLQEGIARLEESLEEVNGSIESIREALSLLEESVEGLEDSLRQLGLAVEGLNESLEALEQAVSSLESRVESLEAGLSEANSEIEALYSSLEALEGALEEVNSSLAEAWSAIGLLSGYVDSLNSTLGYLEETLSGALESIESLEGEVSALKSLVSVLGRSIESLESSLQSLEARLTGLEARHDSLASKLEEVASRVDSLEGDLDARIGLVLGALDDSVETLMEAIEGVEAEAYANLTLIQGEYGALIDSLEESVESLDSRVGLIESELEDVRRVVAGIIVLLVIMTGVAGFIYFRQPR